MELSVPQDNVVKILYCIVSVIKYTGLGCEGSVTYMGNEKCIHSFGLDTVREETTWEN
jgi:hypothetical protein